jgi:anti-sigma-K factor RskA
MTLPDEHLDAALRALSRADANMTSSLIVEARLANVVDRIARRRARWRWAAPLAAAAVLAIGVLALFQSWRQATNGSQATVSVTETGAPEISTAFFMLPSGEMPIASARLVRLEVPRSALQRYGLADLESPENAETVLAEVLVDDAGLARAVRFVHSGPKADRR